ncbi:MAG TPA: tetraacyldisaccharide 4'-kinase [Polyangiaceae bacterium]|jgi:tetraacyldisaccharide 4'-kinase
MPYVARSLEEGRYRGVVARGLAAAWAEVSVRGLARPVPFPAHVHVVAVGGATLGGSGKTPLAIACARELARLGARVAFVGHGYRARPQRARFVSPNDALGEVGDEALVAARALEAHGVRVVVAPSRALAVELAARAADVLVLDGVLQTRPAPASLSLLAVDAEEPWGSAAAVPPRGDLRAPIAALLAAADVVVPVGQDSPDATVSSAGAHLGGSFLAWEALRPLRLGLACALARPRRLMRSLARHGIRPVAVALAQDHHSISPDAMRGPVDLWLTTAKCALHIPPQRVPLATLEYDVACSPTLAGRLLCRAP